MTEGVSRLNLFSIRKFFVHRWKISVKTEGMVYIKKDQNISLMISTTHRVAQYLEHIMGVFIQGQWSYMVQHVSVDVKPISALISI